MQQDLNLIQQTKCSFNKNNMIAISNANQPGWKTINVKSYIPESLKPLEELSRNLWWVWNEEAKELFKMLDANLFKACGGNPVLLLEKLGVEKLDEQIGRAHV